MRVCGLKLKDLDEAIIELWIDLEHDFPYIESWAQIKEELQHDNRVGQRSG